MGRPAKYPEEFRREAVELYRSVGSVSGRGSEVVRDQRRVARRVGEGGRARTRRPGRSTRRSGPSSSGCARRTRICGWIARSCAKQPRISPGRRTGEPQVRLRARRARTRSRGSASSSRFRGRASTSGPAGRCRTTTSTMRGSRTRSTTSMSRRGAPTAHRGSHGQLRTPRPAPRPQAGGADHGRVRPRRRALAPEVAARPARHRARRRTCWSATSPPSVPTSGGSRTSPSSRAVDGKLFLAGIKDLHDQGLRGLVDGRTPDHRPRRQRARHGARAPRTRPAS